ncbi:hypothetical protein BX666DRAFT_1876473 [Dichotomocladium elegans]|nr:hypothetical protein BX666DRAFT_1876473 [Dichotomocladium elegans]
MTYIHPAKVLTSSYTVRSLCSDDISTIQSLSPPSSFRNSISRRLGHFFSIASARKKGADVPLEVPDSPARHSFLTTTAVTSHSDRFEGDPMDDDSDATSLVDMEDEDDYRFVHVQLAMVIALPAAAMAAASAARSKRYRARAARAASSSSMRIRSPATT